MSLVSVVLPTCDRPDLWPRALTSVLAQTHAELEVLLVDSNRTSPPVRRTPGAAALLEDPRVVLVEQPHRACAAAARNVGLAAARGKWVTYLDDDDLYLPDKVRAQLSRAEECKAPLVLCGYTVILPRRRRTRQVQTDAFVGDQLLTAANWGTPMLFHRSDSRVRFDEELAAGEDEVFAHAFLALHHVMSVPSCPRALVEVFPQVGRSRVHHGQAVWPAYRMNYRRVRNRFSRSARRQYLAMGLLVRAQAGFGGPTHFFGRVCSVLATRGWGAWRLALNATGHRFGLFRRWLVS